MATRVLVVDSDSQRLRFFVRGLRHAGYDADAAKTAGEALIRARYRLPDAAIVESNLPDETGVHVCREFRAWSSMPVILLGTCVDDDDIVTGLDAGADDFVRAPVGGDYVVDLLPLMVLFGTGAGIAFPALVGVAMSDVQPQEAGVASGLVNTTAQVGGALGLAVLATVASGRSDDLRATGNDLAHALTGGYHLAFGVGAGLLLMALAVAVFVLRPKPKM